MAKEGENMLARGWMLGQRGRSAGFACQPNHTPPKMYREINKQLLMQKRPMLIHLLEANLFILWL